MKLFSFWSGPQWSGHPRDTSNGTRPKTRTPNYNWQLHRASTFRGSSYCPLFSQRNVAVCTPVTLLSQGEVQGKRRRSANIIYVRQTEAALYFKQPFSICPLRSMMVLLFENTLLCSPTNATPFSLSSQKARRLPEPARPWINVDTTNLTSSMFDWVL